MGNTFQRALTLSIALPISVIVFTTSSSCVSLLELDDYASAIEELCGVVAKCDPAFYPACVDQANARFDAASPSERVAFFNALTETGCLDSCSAAKSCFDLAPLCVGPTAACSVEAQCCGFWKAGAACEGAACCQSDGVTCEQDSDCCGGSCDAFGDGKTCGGIMCAQLDEPCGQGVSCCGAGGGELRCSLSTRTCVHCEPADGPCTSGADCCTDYCDTSESGETVGVCTDPPCGKNRGQPCLSADECCDDYCVPTGRMGLSVCNDSECLPTDFPCETDFVCCSEVCGPSGLCSSGTTCSAELTEPCVDDECCEGECGADSGTCCLAETTDCTDSAECCGDATCQLDATGMGQTICVSDGGCGAHGEACTEADDCCGSCNKVLGYCCVPLDDCEHGVCSTGTPLLRSCVNGSVPNGKPYGDPGCISDVCNDVDFAYCCCDQWDDACVGRAAASNVCNVACAVDPF